MRPLKIFAVALMLILGPVILESCCFGAGSCGCDFSNDPPPSFNTDSMSLTLLPYPTSSTTLPTPAIFSAVDFRVQLEVTYAALKGSFGSALFACSPAEPRANHPISAISITSNTILETTTGNSPAGSDLNSIFEVFYWGGSYGQPVENLIGEREFYDTFSFRSEVVLTKPQTHTFTFFITLSDGREFNLTTPSLQLN